MIFLFYKKSYREDGSLPVLISNKSLILVPNNHFIHL